MKVMYRLLIVTSLLMLLTGCSTVQSTFNAHGPASEQIARMSWFMTALFLVVTVVMWALIAWGFAKRRGNSRRARTHRLGRWSGMDRHWRPGGTAADSDGHLRPWAQAIGRRFQYTGTREDGWHAARLCPR